jgi:hypothetical protein
MACSRLAVTVSAVVKACVCLVIELRATEVDALVRNGLLEPEMRNYSDAVTEALYRFLDHTLGSKM